MSAKKILSSIIEFDTKIADLRDEFDNCDPAEQLKELEEVFDREAKAITEDDVCSIAMVRATDMLVPLGEGGAKVLAKGLSHGNPDVRSLAGEALIGLAEENLSTIRPAVDYALRTGCPAAEEMPFLLAMLEHEDVPKTIAEFLKSSDVRAVAAAIEALADFGDPASVPALKALVKDSRKVTIDGDEDGDDVKEWTVGELAAEAINMIEEEEE